jgi:hypothetical protein
MTHTLLASRIVESLLAVAVTAASVFIVQVAMVAG